MDTSGAYLDYVDRRKKVIAAIAAHERRIERFFLIARCIEGMVILFGLAVIRGAESHNSIVTIVSALGVVVMAIVGVIVGSKQLVFAEAARKRVTEAHLQTVDRGWNEWIMRKRANSAARETE